MVVFIFFFNDTATTEIYTLSLHDSLPISAKWPWSARLLDAGVVALSILRFFWPVYFPFSGHAFFLSYSMMTTRRRWWLLVAAALMAETTVFKLALWDDPGSWATGAALGLMGGIIFYLIAPR